MKGKRRNKKETEEWQRRNGNKSERMENQEESARK
jgi:hypothetical protein